MNIRISWIAADGAEAVECCAADTPDLILMDLIMPRMDGVEATRRIMAATPCAVVIVTADVDRNSPKVFEAMGAGALDAVDTPVMGQQNGSNGARALLAKIETIRKLIGADAGKVSPASVIRAVPAIVTPPLDLVAIGTSAGGPAALAKILSQLDARFSAAMVIVQHVDSQFAEGLASWLNSQSALPVRVAREGDRPEAGTVLLAGQENHLVFASPSRLSYTQDPVDCSISAFD